jgi:hypothetical protein
MKFEIPNWLIIAGGIGQVFTALIYPYIRHVVFDWYNDIKKLKPLNQEIAKTYGRYIQSLNFSFGLITILLTDELKMGMNTLFISFALIFSGLFVTNLTGYLKSH